MTPCRGCGWSLDQRARLSEIWKGADLQQKWDQVWGEVGKVWPSFPYTTTSELATLRSLEF